MAELEVWMRVGQPLEPLLADQERILDAWQSGGVRGLVVGRLAFLTDYPDDLQPPDARGSAAGATHPPSWGGGRAGTVWAFAPNHTVYRRWGVEPPPDPEETFPRRRELLTQLLESVKRRGWSIYLFEPAAGAGPPAPGLPGRGRAR